MNFKNITFLVFAVFCTTNHDAAAAEATALTAGTGRKPELVSYYDVLGEIASRKIGVGDTSELIIKYVILTGVNKLDACLLIHPDRWPEETGLTAIFSDTFKIYERETGSCKRTAEQAKTELLRSKDFYSTSTSKKRPRLDHPDSAYDESTTHYQDYHEHKPSSFTTTFTEPAKDRDFVVDFLRGKTHGIQCGVRKELDAQDLITIDYFIETRAKDSKVKIDESRRNKIIKMFRNYKFGGFACETI